MSEWAVSWHIKGSPKDQNFNTVQDARSHIREWFETNVDGGLFSNDGYFFQYFGLFGNRDVAHIYEIVTSPYHDICLLCGGATEFIMFSGLCPQCDTGCHHKNTETATMCFRCSLVNQKRTEQGFRS